MKNRFMTIILSGLVASTMLSSPVFAESPPQPRANQVQQRIDNQEKRIDAGVKSGQITPKQAARDEKRDAKVESQLKKDEAKHNGTITKSEQQHLNKKLNKNSHAIHHQRKVNKTTTPTTTPDTTK